MKKGPLDRFFVLVLKYPWDYGHTSKYQTFVSPPTDNLYLSHKEKFLKCFYQFTLKFGKVNN